MFSDDLLVFSDDLLFLRSCFRELGQDDVRQSKPHPAGQEGMEVMRHSKGGQAHCAKGLIFVMAIGKYARWP